MYCIKRNNELIDFATIATATSSLYAQLQAYSSSDSKCASLFATYYVALGVCVNNGDGTSTKTSCTATSANVVQTTYSDPLCTTGASAKNYSTSGCNLMQDGSHTHYKASCAMFDPTTVTSGLASMQYNGLNCAASNLTGVVVYTGGSVCLSQNTSSGNSSISFVCGGSGNSGSSATYVYYANYRNKNCSTIDSTVYSPVGQCMATGGASSLSETCSNGVLKYNFFNNTQCKGTAQFSQTQNSSCTNPSDGTHEEQGCYTGNVNTLANTVVATLYMGNGCTGAAQYVFANSAVGCSNSAVTSSSYVCSSTHSSPPTSGSAPPTSGSAPPTSGSAPPPTSSATPIAVSAGIVSLLFAIVALF